MAAAAAAAGASSKRPSGVLVPMADGDDESEIIKYRLLTKETVFLGRSAKKVLEKYAAFGALTMDEGSTDSARRSAGDAMRCELGLFGLEVSKTALQVAAWEREADECGRLAREASREIDSKGADIARLRVALARAHEVRKWKDECEGVARQVLKLPSVKDSRAELDSLQADIAALEALDADKTKALATHRRRFALLRECINELLTADDASPSSSSSSSEKHNGEAAAADGVVVVVATTTTTTTGAEAAADEEEHVKDDEHHGEAPAATRPMEVADEQETGEIVEDEAAPAGPPADDGSDEPATSRPAKRPRLASRSHS